jgi:uncharacterized protein YyaL (SSP411 family)
MSLRHVLHPLLDDRVRLSWRAIKQRGDFRVLWAVLRGSLGLNYAVGTNLEHLQAAMGWLCMAQDRTPDGGVSAFYDLAKGVWAPSYPETTGYIIPTFLDYAAYTGQDDYRTRAVRMADWLLTLQMDTGAFPMGPLWDDLDRQPLVFDTGQILHGLLRIWQETDSLCYLEAARRAGDWLVEIQETDGSWPRFTFLGHVYTHHARVAWALLKLAQASADERYRRAGLRNLGWTWAQQTTNGWFNNAAFAPDEEPLTHTLGYTIRSLLESGLLLSDERMIAAARSAADALVDRLAQVGYLQGTYDSSWHSSARWSCLTGDVQMAIVWLKLYQYTKDKRYIKAAIKVNRYVKSKQRRGRRASGINGGIAGSFPVDGEYHPYLHVNWAAKFLVDSLLLEERLRVEGASL